jgi:hypothetical protein
VPVLAAADTRPRLQPPPPTNPAAARVPQVDRCGGQLDQPTSLLARAGVRTRGVRQVGWAGGGVEFKLQVQTIRSVCCSACPKYLVDLNNLEVKLTEFNTAILSFLRSAQWIKSFLFLGKLDQKM